MKGERIIAAVVVAAAALGGIAIQQGYLTLGPATGAVIGFGAGLEMPDLDDPALIRRAAAHFDIACAGCHGSPAVPTRAQHLRLTPPAPLLHERIDDWLPEVLFLTVKHGIPDTAMPAWPAHGRDDEIWAMVAFLKVLPGLEPEAYRNLAGLNATLPPGAPKAAALCIRCHGTDGRGDPNGAFPRLDIQSPAYLADALTAYRAKRRQSGFMAIPAAALNPADVAVLAGHFGRVEPTQSTPPLPRSGEDDHVPDCTACHGTTSPVRPDFPVIAGQYPNYLASQLRLFAAEEFTRGGGPFVHLMREAGHDLDEDAIIALSQSIGLSP